MYTGNTFFCGVFVLQNVSEFTLRDQQDFYVLMDVNRRAPVKARTTVCEAVIYLQMIHAKVAVKISGVQLLFI